MIVPMAVATVVALLAGLLIACSSPLIFPFWSWRIRLVSAAASSPFLRLISFSFNRLLRGASPGRSGSPCPSAVEGEEDQYHSGITCADLRGLCSYIDETDGGPPWQLLMERSTPTLALRAWRREPKFGPAQYRAQIVIENVGPELLREFIWDDEFRTKWDDTVIYFKTLWECPHSGTMIVQWIRKFPFFCGDREYVIIRRIWESGSTFYCVSKDIQFPSIPEHNKPSRVDLYYSSWRIRPVESRNKENTIASEVLLFHYEEMNMPKMIERIGIHSAMWYLVKKLDHAVQAYHLARQNGTPPSRYALMARINTRAPISTNLLPGRAPEHPEDHLEACGLRQGRSMMKLLVVCGVLAICGLKVRPCRLFELKKND